MERHMEGEVNRLRLGTIVLALQKPDAIYMGVDSRVVTVGESVGNAAYTPKIHQVNDIVFAHAGIFKDTDGKLDVAATADAAIAEGGDLDHIVARFTTAIERQLSATLPDIRSQNPSYFATQLKRPLEVLFASGRGGLPRSIVLAFQMMDTSAHHLTFGLIRLKCPGDCPQASVAATALGEHDAADRFLDAHPEILRVHGPVAAIKAAIAHQASATPEFVSLPTVMMLIDRLGIHFLQ
jgi:hypothetical protein